MIKGPRLLRINALANFTASAWTAILSFALVPIYIRSMGIESYGMVGILVMLQAMVALFDFGLSATLNRELARAKVSNTPPQFQINIVRTLSLPNLGTAVIVLIVLSSFAPIVANYWIQNEQLTTGSVIQALLLISFIIAIQFVISFYSSGLMGLQEQARLSVANILCGTLRTIGSAVVVSFVAPTIQAFLFTHAVVAALQLVIVWGIFWRRMPQADSRAKFSLPILKNVMRFAGGVSMVTIVSFLLSQTDRIVLSRMLPLEDFGYYTLAISIPSILLGLFVASIGQATYPQLTSLLEQQDYAALLKTYHSSCQLISVLIFAATSILVFFPREVLFVWIGDTEIVERTRLLLVIFSVGTCLNSLIWLPYFLQLAHGQTRLVLTANTIGLLFLTPSMIYAVSVYGALGAGLCWVALNLSYVFILVPAMHRRMLTGEYREWLLRDVGIPLIVSFGIAGAIRWMYDVPLTRSLAAVYLIGVSTLVLFLTSLSTSSSRGLLSSVLYSAMNVRRVR